MQAIHWPMFFGNILTFTFVLTRKVTHVITNRNYKAPVIA